MKNWKRLLGALILIFVLVYGGDYVWVRARITFPKLGKALDTLQMERLYAIPLKSGKLEYDFDPQQPEFNVTCVHSLFPHMGFKPCWYLRRQSDKPIVMDIILVTRP